MTHHHPIPSYSTYPRDPHHLTYSFFTLLFLSTKRRERDNYKKGGPHKWHIHTHFHNSSKGGIHHVHTYGYSEKGATKTHYFFFLLKQHTPPAFFVISHTERTLTKFHKHAHTKHTVKTTRKRSKMEWESKEKIESGFGLLFWRHNRQISTGSASFSLCSSSELSFDWFSAHYLIDSVLNLQVSSPPLISRQVWPENINCWQIFFVEIALISNQS